MLTAIDNNGLTYVIFDVSELPLIDFNEVLQTSADTVRKSVDGTKTLVKWTTGIDIPECVKNLTTKGPYMTYNEIAQVMNTPEWSDDPDR